jgi:hypothetical protein
VPRNPAGNVSHFEAGLGGEGAGSACRDTTSGVDARGSLVPPHSLPRFREDVTPRDAVVQRVETTLRMPLGCVTQPVLELLHFVRGLLARRGGWTESPRSCPRAYLRHRHDHPRGPSLPPRYSARRSFARLAPPSSVLRPPRTPAAQRPTSPLAYTTRLAPTRATQTGLPCSALLLARVLRPYPAGTSRRASDQAPPVLPSP